MPMPLMRFRCCLCRRKYVYAAMMTRRHAYALSHHHAFIAAERCAVRAARRCARMMIRRLRACGAAIHALD